ncbi:MAG: DUF1190 domain-containing protein [Magnetovibrionaceae bacterium]
MKRSSSVSLLAMGTVALSLTACEEQTVDAAVFENVEQCGLTEGFTLAQCETEHQNAVALHEDVAPKYTSIAACEADFGEGQCGTSETYQNQGGGSIFLPLMMGYMMGSMLGGQSSFGSQPLYRSKDDPGTFRTANNAPVAKGTGVTNVPKSTTARPAAKRYTVARGGFGSRAGTLGGTPRSSFGG